MRTKIEKMNTLYIHMKENYFTHIQLLIVFNIFL